MTTNKICDGREGEKSGQVRLLANQGHAGSPSAKPTTRQWQRPVLVKLMPGTEAFARAQTLFATFAPKSVA